MGLKHLANYTIEGCHQRERVFRISVFVTSFGKKVTLSPALDGNDRIHSLA